MSAIQSILKSMSGSGVADGEREDIDGVVGTLRYGLLPMDGVETDEFIVDFAWRVEAVCFDGGAAVSCLRRRML